MRAKLKYVAASVLLTLGVAPLLMGPTGGFPSRPTFQQVTTQGAATEQLISKGNATGASNVVVSGFHDSAGTRTGYIGDASPANADISVVCETNPCNVNITPTGTGTTNVSALHVVAGGQVNFDLGTSGFQEFVNRSAGALGFKWYTGALGTGNNMTLDTSGVLTVASGLTVNSVSLTPATATATGTVTGCTTAPTSNLSFTKIGNLVVGRLTGVTCTSNATSFTMTGAVPAAFQPSTSILVAMNLEDNGVLTTGGGFMNINGGTSTMTFGWAGSIAGFTAAGLKGIPGNYNFSYVLN